MKIRTMLLALSILTLLLVSCGQDGNPQVEPSPKPTDHNAPVSIDATWDDIPLYPGANLKLGYPREMYFPGNETVWTWLYQADADQEQMHAFYLKEMPKLGWREKYHTEEPLASYWDKQDGHLEATVSVMGQPSQATVALSRAEKTPKIEGEQPVSTGEPGAGSPMVQLDVLDSYRATVTTWQINKDGSESSETVNLTWLRDPPAVHFINPSFTEHEELIAIGDFAWDKVDDVWVKNPDKLDVNVAFTQAERLWLSSILGRNYEYFWQEAILVGEETVNGVQTRQYALDMDALPGRNIHVEVWIANQPDLPPVPIRGIYETIQSGATTLRIEADITGINAPVVIEAPE